MILTGLRLTYATLIRTQGMDHGHVSRWSDPPPQDANIFCLACPGWATRPFILTVKKLGDGNGKVTAPGFTCLERKCAGNYNSYEVVNLTAKS